jgi:hypothetical protein
MGPQCRVTTERTDVPERTERQEVALGVAVLPVLTL